MKKRNILVTSALAYANGELHLGHMLEHIQTDIWARFQNAQGNKCYAICGDDSHGTAIMLNAEKNKQAPQDYIAAIQKSHEADLADFLIHYDQYGNTDTSLNQQFVEEIFSNLQHNGDIETRTIEQAFDPEKQLFLPDRFIKGHCPKCDAADQYGDNCEQCGATYSPADLTNARSVLSDATPITKPTTHYFFKLSHYQDSLQRWLNNGHVSQQLANKLMEWFEQGLNDWDISRDAPYFGFKIPEEEDKYFYVWVDAPVGYLSIFKQFCDKQQRSTDTLTDHGTPKFEDYWSKSASAEVYHFIGKDIAYFHCLFWPAMLKGAKLRRPTAIFTHGFLTVNGQKMSKSRGTFITAKHYLSQLKPAYLRYYLACKLNAGQDDIDLNLEDFVTRVNSDLIGKVINIASRSASFIVKKFDGILASTLHAPELFAQFSQTKTGIAQHYESRDYAKAMREIMQLADLCNQYIDQHKPWTLAKSADTLPQVQIICTMALNLFYQLMIYLAPVLPDLAHDTQTLLNCNPLQWQHLQTPLLSHRINAFKPMLQRLELATIEQLLQSTS